MPSDDHRDQRSADHRNHTDHPIITHLAASLNNGNAFSISETRSPSLSNCVNARCRALDVSMFFCSSTAICTIASIILFNATFISLTDSSILSMRSVFSFFVGHYHDLVTIAPTCHLVNDVATSVPVVLVTPVIPIPIVTNKLLLFTDRPGP